MNVNLLEVRNLARPMLSLCHFRQNKGHHEKKMEERVWGGGSRFPCSTISFMNPKSWSNRSQWADYFKYISFYLPMKTIPFNVVY